jgi:hypothetical protein
MSIHCAYCGRENDEHHRLCVDCGTDLIPAHPAGPKVVAALRGQVRSQGLRRVLLVLVFVVAYALSIAIIVPTAGWYLRALVPQGSAFRPEVGTLLGAGPYFVAFGIAAIVAWDWWRRSRSPNKTVEATETRESVWSMKTGDGKAAKGLRASPDRSADSGCRRWPPLLHYTHAGCG